MEFILVFYVFVGGVVFVLGSRCYRRLVRRGLRLFGGGVVEEIFGGGRGSGWDIDDF